jgi:RimJ/RimL family protein N-acetyltransferase
VTQTAHAIKALRRNARDYGAAIAARKLLQRLLYPLWYVRDYLLYRADLDTISITAPTDTTLRPVRITVERSDLVAQIEALEEWLANKVQRKLQGGSICLALLDGQTVAGFNLVSFKRIWLPNVHFHKPLRPNEAFSEQITVNAAYRGKGVGATIRRRVFAELKAMGVKRLYGGTDSTNAANLALSRKVGFREVAIIHNVRILKYSRTKVIRRHAPNPA